MSTEEEKSGHISLLENLNWLDPLQEFNGEVTHQNGWDGGFSSDRSSYYPAYPPSHDNLSTPFQSTGFNGDAGRVGFLGNGVGNHTNGVNNHVNGVNNHVNGDNNHVNGVNHINEVSSHVDGNLVYNGNMISQECEQYSNNHSIQNGNINLQSTNVQQSFYVLPHPNYQLQQQKVSAYNWAQYTAPNKPYESLASETNSDVNTPRINLKLNRDENGGWQAISSTPWTQNENKYNTENSLNNPLSSAAGPIKYEINPLKREHDSYNWSPDVKPKIQPEIKSEVKPLKVKPECVKTNPKDSPRKVLKCRLDADKLGDMSKPMETVPIRILERDLKYFSPEEQNQLLEKKKSLKDVFPACDCTGRENGPWYTHLGYAENPQELRKQIEERVGESGNSIRFLQVQLAGYEGKSTEQCPVPKWVIRRSSKLEKFVVVFKIRPGHKCKSACIAVALLQYDALDSGLSAQAYSSITNITNANIGTETKRACGINAERTCRCQGTNSSLAGQSYTWGCSNSIYNYDLCKFSRARDPAEVRQFKLDNKPTELEDQLKCVIDKVADSVAVKHKVLAPDCYNNMALFGNYGCRIGTGFDRPYSGVTTVVDFCAHAHEDKSNMIGGCTAIITLTKPELRQELRGPNSIGGGSGDEDEQLHCLPLYLPCATEAELEASVADRGIEILNKFKKKVVVGSKTKSCKAQMRASKSKEMGEGSPRKRIKREEWITTSQAEQSSSQPQSPAQQENVQVYESDCHEVFESPETGGVAFSLPHGSMLLEVAKHELHATTALKNPNRLHPTRIGLVFYQHFNLHFSTHAKEVYVDKQMSSHYQKYVDWLAGDFAPIACQLKTLTAVGFVFPPNIRLKNTKGEKMSEKNRFNPQEFPGFTPGRIVDGVFTPINGSQTSESQAREPLPQSQSENSPTQQSINCQPQQLQGDQIHLEKLFPDLNNSFQEHHLYSAQAASTIHSQP